MYRIYRKANGGGEPVQRCVSTEDGDDLEYLVFSSLEGISVQEGGGRV